MIQQGVWFLFSLRRMRWVYGSSISTNSVSSNSGNGSDSKEIREWLCYIIALFIALPMVLLVTHLIFTATLNPAPPPPDEHEVMCRHTGVYNDTVREHHVVNHYPDIATTTTNHEKVINVDVVYLRHRIDCTIAKRYHDIVRTTGAIGDDDKTRRIFTLDAFGTTEHDIVLLLNATLEAERLYPTGSPPFRRWQYDNDVMSETPDVMGWGYWLVRWIYYIMLVAVLSPLSYLMTCTLTLYCPLPRPLLVLAIRVRLWLANTSTQSCV